MNERSKDITQKKQKPRYESLEHTADVYIKAHGSTLAEAFENAAFALFDTITDVSGVKSIGEYRIELAADNQESILVNFLNELLFIWETEGVLLSEFNVTLSEIDGKDNKGKCMIKALVRGEKYDEKKHIYKTQIKSVTYHGIGIAENNDVSQDERYSVNVLFDV
jgi:SHS2 domain-containing protein